MKVGVKSTLNVKGGVFGGAGRRPVDPHCTFLYFFLPIVDCTFMYNVKGGLWGAGRWPVDPQRRKYDRS